MTARLSRRRLALVLAAAGAAAAAGLLVFQRATPGPTVPLYRLEPQLWRRVVSAEGTLRPQKASALTAPSEGRSLLIAWMAEDGAPVKKGDVVLRFDQNDASRALADGKDDEQAARVRIDKERAIAQGAVADRGRAAGLTRVEIAHASSLGKKDPRFFPRTEVIESEIDEGLLRTRLAQTEVARTAEQRLGEDRIEMLAVDRRKAELQRTEAERTLASLEVRAPHAGTFVVQRQGWAQRQLQPGDRAFPGMRVAEVATTERMEADVMVLEADAGGLAPGKPAQIVLEARPDQSFAGKVKKVDAFPKTRHPEVPTQYFGAVLGMSGDTAGLKPGQRLRAQIVLDEIKDALVIPRQAVVTRADGSFVQRRRRGGGFETVKVTLGAGTVGRVLVSAGLAAGDRIALRDTARSADELIAPSERRSPGKAPPSEGRGRR